MSMTPPAVRMAMIDKRFGAVHANRQASIEVLPGEIHALMGENGAGKSTLMKILAGLHKPDSGQVAVRGQDVTGWSTGQAIASGVGMVHQHFMLVPTLTVAENIILGREPLVGRPWFGVLDRRAATEEAVQLCEISGLSVPVDKKVADLSVGEAQRVEILKILYRGARILLLDEPTAVLSPPEVKELWRVLRKLQSGGATIVLISHKLDEVMEISDRITVMRQGRTELVLQTRDTTPEALARAMVGRDVDLTVRAQSSQPGANVLDVRNLSALGNRGERALHDVSLQVAAGEILGIAGVEGNGQTELLEAIAGLRPATGEIVLAGRRVDGLSVRDRAAAGLSHVPEDRHQRGLILEFSVADNLILGQQQGFARHGLLAAPVIAAHAARLAEEYDIRPRDTQLAVRALSGGNQQKVVIARELSRQYRLLLAAQPTRGVDVGAIEFIHEQLRSARSAGKAVLLVSAELREVLTLADRIAVMFRGRIVAVLPRGEATEEVLGPWMTGANGGAP